MVIDSNNNIPTSAGNPRNRVNTAPAESKHTLDRGLENNAPKPGADVSLSERARVLSKLESQLDSTADVNAERVAEIRKAIAEGSYRIDAESIAGRMLEQDSQF